MLTKIVRFNLLLLFAFSTTTIVAQSKIPAGTALRVVLIRHGEKPPKGNNLSCQGFNRAKALPPVLYNKFGVPDFTLVPTISMGKSTKSVRMFQTVTPFAIKYDLKVNTAYSETDTMTVAKALQSLKGLALLVWEHSNIPGIARNLGATNVPAWPGDDFDSIWIIDFIPQPNGTTTVQLSFDKEGLKPGSSCN
jgi:hypothetical protein